MDADVRILPIFPLRIVLFPHMKLPLHIFEERYKEMITECLARDRTFGVALIRSGREVGGYAEPHEVGTVARITEVETLADGRMGLMTLGQQRFHLLEVEQEQPYLTAQVELLEEPLDPSALVTVLDAAQSLAEAWLQRGLALNSEWMRRIDLPREPDILSFLIATRITADLPVKQQLLTAHTVADRLRQEIPLLQQECERLDRLLMARQWARNETWN